MYAVKAFAIKKLIRKVLVEAFFEFQSQKGRLNESLDVHTIDGEHLTDFHQWSAELEHQFNKLNDTQAGIKHQIDLRNSISGSENVLDSGYENG